MNNTLNIGDNYFRGRMKETHKKSNNYFGE